MMLKQEESECMNEAGDKSSMTVSFEPPVENGMATLCDGALKLYVKGTERCCHGFSARH